MKLTMAIVVYILIGLVLGWGMLLVYKGNYWILIASLLAYVLAFAWIGCMEH